MISAQTDSGGWLLTYVDVFILTTALFASLYLLQPGAQEPMPLQVAQTLPAAEEIQATEIAERAPMANPPELPAVAPVPVPASEEIVAQEATPIAPPVEEQQVLPDLPEGMEFAQESGKTRLRIGDTLLFEPGQASLSAQGELFLGLVYPVIQDSSGEVIIEGHTDSIPIRTALFDSNWALSSARAQYVLQHLLALGVEEHRLRTMAFADTQPLASNRTGEGRSRNRRVEIVLVHAEP